MLNDKKFGELVKRAARIAYEGFKVNQELTEAFEERYGCTYSDADEETLVDILDYGYGGQVTTAMCDKLMAETGNPKTTE